MTDVWTDDRVKELKRLYDRGLSFSKIAAELDGDFSRNACIGKYNRFYGAATVRRIPVKQAVRPKVRKTFGVGAQVQAINRGPVIKAEIFICADAADIIPRHLSLLELEENDCRQPYGDDVFTFCGHPKLEGSSYCPAHYRLNRTGIPPRKTVVPTAFGQSKGGIFGRVA